MYSSAYVWAKILNRLEEQLDPVSVSAWFEDAQIIELNDANLILYSPSDFRRDVIVKRYTSYIEDALKDIFQSNAKLLVYGDKEMDSFRSKEKTATVMDFNPQFSFENFIVGKSNRFAYSACTAVSNDPGNIYNPLFIYGPSGVGKTHLLYAIANSIRHKRPDANIVYIKGDEFTNELIAAIETGKNVEFRNKYRESDLFLIDDIQFIAGKESTQEEFFHTFNKLYEEHKQIVMTSDRKPGDMLTLEDRLRTRFEWGLIADIQTPDYETRMAILKTKAGNFGLTLSNEVCDYIAKTVTNNVRQIEGVVKRLMAYHDLDGMPLDLPNVARVIEDLFKSEGSALPTPALIISQVCKFYSVEESVIRGTIKRKNVAEARQMAMYLIRYMTNLSLPDIGKEFNRDHSTALYAIRRVETALKAKDKVMMENVRNIQENINSAL